MIYLWSDTHFGHRGILEYCAATRPYASVEEMDEALIRAWNSVVKPTDEMHFLGDFGFGRDLASVFERLAGRKHLVRGNHDEQNPRVLKLPWLSQKDIATLRQQGTKAIACHYPMESWRGAHKGYLHVHGHSHGSLKRKLPHRFDVGADVYGVPVGLDELALVAAAQTFLPTDHHAADL